MNQEFLDYCKLNFDKPLPLLFDQFKKKYSNFDINEFISWKSSLNQSELIAEFYNFPFLRDQLFLSFIKTLEPNNLENFEGFILNSQTEYFKKFIKPEFNQQILKKSSVKVSKCPFAPIPSSSSPIKPFSYEQISTVRYSLIEDIHISDMKIDNLTVNIVKPDNERAHDAMFTILLTGIHHNLDFNNSNVQYIMMTDTKLLNTIPLLDERLPSCRIINEILKIKPLLTSSDALFLVPKNVLVINSFDIDRLLNLIIYLNILKLPLNLEVLKSIGLTSKNINPSFLEPYADVLTPEYVQNNAKLFQ